MPNISTRVGQYCISHGYIHEEEYLECDYCNEHKDWICLKDRYYNYGFSRHSYLACMECHSNLFGPFKLIDGGVNRRTIIKGSVGKSVSLAFIAKAYF